MKLTALMTVHDAVAPEHLHRALRSVADQTRPPEEILVVQDGPLGEPLAQVLEEFRASAPDVVHLIALPVNVGSGAASDVGLRAARHEIVARMDSDDVALPHRFAVQLEELESKGLDVVGSSMLEFEGGEDDVVALRSRPESHEAIARLARLQSPVNNPTVMMRRGVVLAAGGYVEIKYVEDYDLFARMLARGARFGNVPEPLLLFRTSPAMFRRRRGLALLRSEWILQRRLQQIGLIGPLRRARNLVVRSVFRLLPSRLLRVAYGRLLRDRRVPGSVSRSPGPGTRRSR